MTTTTKPKTLTMTIPAAATSGIYWLTGYHGHDGTARFDLDFDIESGDPIHPVTTGVILRNADWPTTWKALHSRIKNARVEQAMRGVLPPV